VCISTIQSANEIKKRKTSQYANVYYESSARLKNPWRISFKIKGKKITGYFATEKQAGKKVNALCKEYGKCKRNKDLSENERNEIVERKEKASKYVGVTYNKTQTKNPWGAKYYLTHKTINIGYFDTERKAAKQVNLMYRIYNRSKPKQNEGLS
jgi:hypothetical protein